MTSYETLFFSQQKLVVAELLIARVIHEKQEISPLRISLFLIIIVNDSRFILYFICWSQTGVWSPLIIRKKYTVSFICYIKNLQGFVKMILVRIDLRQSKRDVKYRSSFNLCCLKISSRQNSLSLSCQSKSYDVALWRCAVWTVIEFWCVISVKDNFVSMHVWI